MRIGAFGPWTLVVVFVVLLASPTRFCEGFSQHHKTSLSPSLLSRSTLTRVGVPTETTQLFMGNFLDDINNFFRGNDNNNEGTNEDDGSGLEDDNDNDDEDAYDAIVSAVVVRLKGE